MSAVQWALIAVYAYYQRRVFGAMARPIIVLCVFVLLWSLIHTIEASATTLSLKVAAHGAKNIAMLALPISWLWFAASYANLTTWLTRRRLLLIGLVPAITALLIVTNDAHHLVWSSLDPVRMGEVTVVGKERGLWGWFYILYSYGLIIYSDVKMLHFITGTGQIYRKKYLTVITLFLLPVVANPLFSLGILPIDVTPFSLALSGIGVAWTLFSYRLIDLAPLAHNIVTESMADGMLVIDGIGKIFSVNPAALAILGEDAAELIGKPYHSVLHDLMRSQYQSSGSGLQSTGQMQRVVHGELRYLELRMSHLRDENDRIVGRVAIIRDITRRKENEVRLKAALDAEKELNALRARFVSIVSHEFRMPMSIIQVTAEMIQRYHERMDAESLQEKFTTITQQIGLMNVLIEDVLSLDRLQNGSFRYSPERLPVCDTILTLLDEMRVAADVAARVRIESPPEEAEAPIDQKLLRLVIRNLVGNALKYSPAPQPVTVTLKFEGDEFHMAIRDHGIGIPEHDQQRLFDPFFRAGNVGDIPGSGLGLLIVKQAVELQGGSIRFTSRVNEGTTFHVTLPLEGAVPQAVEEEALVEQMIR
ncbi:MAG: PAS domain S-box protein [Anaerolineae bacterium]|nr:PAS domain S-box protein [Anaerolineae bacterium]